ncbi:hypothetical protein [Micromonospora sp. NPDC049171]|uniref:hypothetical protein n=1 Tax=Micromonospora sp. NPDC049171 TaxID=3155770 RepID=UPI0033F7BF48
MAKRLLVLRVTAAAAIVAGLPALSGSTAHRGAVQVLPAQAAASAPPDVSSASRGSAGSVDPAALAAPSAEGMIEAAQARLEPRVASRRGPARSASPRAPVIPPVVGAAGGARSTPPQAPTTRLAPVTAIHSQAAIDRGALVTWTTSPTCLLAGHDTMGWAWLDDLPAGRVVRVVSGPCAGTYQVVGRRWQPRKGGTMPHWASRYDLVLQTCTGPSGTGFSTARRLSR